MRKLTVILSLSVLTVACSGKPSQKSMLPDGGPTTKQVYEAHLGGRFQGKSQVASNNDDSPYSGVIGQRVLSINDAQSSSSSNELDGIRRDFRKVANPEIVGYIYPHLSTNNHPVPGYFTLFNLYESDSYAVSRSEGRIAPLQGGN